MRICEYPFSFPGAVAFLFLAPSLAIAQANTPPSSSPSSSLSSQLSSPTCSSDFSATAWKQADVDSKFRAWLASSDRKPGLQVPSQLASQFTSQGNFRCGIGQEPTCSALGCQEVTKGGQWPYLVLNSIVNLNTFYNELRVGISDGQIDFIGLAPRIAQDFFPWKDPSYPADSLAFWIVAAITTVAAVFAGPGADAVIAVGAGAFLGAITQQTTLSLKPATSQNQRLSELGSYAAVTGQTTRASIEMFANATFLDLPQNLSGKSIADFLDGGSFAISATSTNWPTSAQIESFFKTQLLARMINTAWTSQNVRAYIFFEKTANETMVRVSNYTRWYSEEDKGMYYLFQYSGHAPTLPPGLDKLSNVPYSISISDLIEGAVRAYKHSGFDYSQEVALSQIASAPASNGSLTPFSDGLRWEGILTVPVCLQGNYDITGGLPCCCGFQCNETKAFVQAGHLLGDQGYLSDCYSRLEGASRTAAAAGVFVPKFEDIDYGFSFHKKSSFDAAWEKMNAGKRFGVVLGFLIAGLYGLGLICAFVQSAITGE